MKATNGATLSLPWETGTIVSVASQSSQNLGILQASSPGKSVSGVHPKRSNDFVL